MRCPKCGYDNPPDTLFCEECDWRLDVPYKPPKKRNPMAFSAVALIVGIIAIALCFVGDSSVAAIAIGAVGLVLGSYSVNIPRYMPDCDNKNMYMGIAGIGMILSVCGFMLGLMYFAGVL